MQSDPSVEAARLRSLRALSLLDTLPEERFDRLTRLASRTFAVPIALVTLVDSERQWFKSRVGLAASETPRPVAFCSHAVEKRALLVVSDTLQDPLFRDNPLVTDGPAIRFYAGQPIFTCDGAAVGTLCIIDIKPRQFSEEERSHLEDLATLVQDELNKHALLDAKMAAERALYELNGQLEKRIDERTRAMRETNEALKREIRQRESVEATLRRSEERIRTLIASSFSAFVGIDAQGAIVDWNASAERTFGWQRGDVMGRALAEIIFRASSRDVQRAGMQRFLDAGDDSAVEQRMQVPAITRQGLDITVEMTISAYGSDEGLFFGLFLHDISSRQRAEHVLQQKNELINAVLETIDVGVVACSAEGELTLFNRAAREFHGLSIEAVDPHQWSAHYSLFEADGKTELGHQNVPLFRALQGETIKDYGMVVAPTGMRPRMLLASGRGLTGIAGERLGAVVAMKDITEVNDSQRRLRQNEHRLRSITENLPALIGQVDKQCRFVFLNSQAAHFYGRPLEQLLGKPVQSAYSKNDFAKIEAYIARAMAGERVSFEEEIVVGGRRSYYSATYIPDLDAQGAVQGFYAMAFDITFRKNSELAQHDSEERLRTITDNLPVLISYKDRDMRFQFANSLYRQWYGAAADNMIGRTALEIYGAEWHLERSAHFARCLQGETVTFELPATHGDRTRTVRTVLVPHWREGVVQGAYALSTDVTEARHHEAQLKQLADTDSLTGLPNRRSYEAALAGAVARAARAREPIALIYLDVDHFKTINDSLGHAAGDEVLKTFAARLRKAVRKSDFVSRLAGDEFTIVLEGVHSPAQCERVAGKIIAAMHPRFTIAGQSLSVTVSIGIAWDVEGTVDDVALGHWADAALYQAKDGGRNRHALVHATA
ncbi:PAS domain S-box protein [Massilia sp. CF038]|uniref:sensor domain-containing diguanylate cyclase n=1 Tax=Massilia sp. CF038 TaxID=1881045 RepID=UPI000918285B|nr:PAS domain S-box protein [Massilia sp. CF038]SHG65200.1 PAS domain S-box-containing protein/diguanylate cyclase (GGDEF) domain-containing protein [Massilia sp. CF038]